MPYKTDKTALSDAFLKRSSKLLPCQKEMVLYWHERGYSQRALAAMFKVSRRLIQFIIDPEKHQENLRRRNERGGWSVYYDKEKNTATQREHRRYKYQILKNTKSNDK